MKELETVKNISYTTGEIIKMLNAEELEKEFFRQTSKAVLERGSNIALVIIYNHLFAKDYFLIINYSTFLVVCNRGELLGQITFKSQ
jgi:hypothetical protein